MTWLIYDGVVVAILLLGFFLCWHKGFVSALVDVAALAASGAVAVIVSGLIAPALYGILLQKRVEEALQSAGSQMSDPWLQSLVSTNGAKVTEILTSGIRVVAGVVLFAVAFLLLSLIARAFRGLNRIPVLGSVNRLLGGILGLAIGLVICLVLATAAAIVLLFSDGSIPWLSHDIIDSTYLFSILYRYNLLVFL